MKCCNVGVPLNLGQNSAKDISLLCKACDWLLTKIVVGACAVTCISTTPGIKAITKLDVAHHIPPVIHIE